MKDYYFTSGTIDRKSNELLVRLKDRFKLIEINEYIPKQSALLILDMQRYFLDKHSHAFIPSALPIISKLKKMATVYIKKGLPVILTRHLNTTDDAQVMARWWKDLIQEGDELSEIIPKFKLPCTEIIIKTQYDGFYKTPLEKILKDKGISQLIVTGVMTHLCCETTARSAFVKGFDVFFSIDGTATYYEDFHWASLLNLTHGFAVPILLEDLIMKIEE